MLEKIRQNSEEMLRKYEARDIPLFLIDSYELDKFDFEKLKVQLICDFPDLKREALILSLQSSSREMIRLKVNQLRIRALVMAGVSATMAVAPIPGVSIVVDTAIVCGEAVFYFKQLGLDDESLRRHAKLYSADYNEMRSTVNKALGIVNVAQMAKCVTTLLTTVGPAVAMAATEEAVSAIPIIGTILAVPMSFASTNLALNLILDKFQEVATEVTKCSVDGMTRPTE